jgi:hypothetical protein
MAQLRLAQGDRLFHVTDAENLAGLLRLGLRPGSASQFDRAQLRAGCVYLCVAAKAREALLDYLDVSWGDTVVSVRLADLDPSHLVADEDYWRGEAQARGLSTAAAAIIAAKPEIDRSDLLLASVLDGGTIAYRGTIAAGLLRVELIPPRPDLPALKPLREALRGSPYYGSGLTERAFLATLARRWRDKVTDY